MINLKKISQIDTIILEAEKKVKKAKYIKKNEPLSGKEKEIFDHIKKDLVNLKK